MISEELRLQLELMGAANIAASIIKNPAWEFVDYFLISKTDPIVLRHDRTYSGYFLEIDDHYVMVVHSLRNKFFGYFNYFTERELETEEYVNWAIEHQFVNLDATLKETYFTYDMLVKDDNR